MQKPPSPSHGPTRDVATMGHSPKDPTFPTAVLTVRGVGPDASCSPTATVLVNVLRKENLKSEVT